MSEYIVDIPESYPFKIVQDGWHYHVEFEYQQREEIVRCRDCKHYTDDKVEYSNYCNEWCGHVKPNGFCALGEKAINE